MRNFIYENLDKLYFLTNQMLVRGKRKTKCVRKDDSEFLKVLIAFSIIYMEGEIQIMDYDTLKKTMMEVDASRKNQIFFEKVEMKTDRMFFEEYL